MKAEELDKKFDDGEDVLDLFDLTSLKRPALEIQSVSAEFDLQEFLLTHVTQKPKKVSETAIPSEIAAKP